MLHNQHIYPNLSAGQNRPMLRSEIMREDYVRNLRERDIARRSRHWKTAWQSALRLSEHLAIRIGTVLLNWAERRMQVSLHH